MKIKNAILSAVLCCSIMLSGCSIIGIDNTELMRPPKATGDKAEIQKVVDEKTSGNYTLKYPQTGEYRSAIIMQDLNSDGVQEAIVLYKNNNETTPETNLMVIADKNGTWDVAGIYSNQSSEVNKIAFADLNGDGSLEIIAGWGAYNSTINQISAYTYNGENTSEITINETYSSFAIGNYTDDNSDEIMLFSLYTADIPSSVKLLDWKFYNNSIYVADQTTLDPNITKFINITTGKIADNQLATIVDGTTSIGTYNTQVVYYDTNKSQLKNILYSPKLTNATQRDIPVVCSDVNNDTILEIPTVVKMKSESNEDSVTVASATTWNIYNTIDDTLTPSSIAIENQVYNYSYTLSSEWVSNVTARINSSEGTLTFYRWDEKQGKKSDKLLTIKVFNAKDWLIGGEPKGYKLLEKNTTYAYAYSIVSGDNKFIPTDDQVVKNFNLKTSATSSNTSSSIAKNK